MQHTVTGVQSTYLLYLLACVFIALPCHDLSKHANATLSSAEPYVRHLYSTLVTSSLLVLISPMDLLFPRLATASRR
jgi:hypothetical protein